MKKKIMNLAKKHHFLLGILRYCRFVIYRLRYILYFLSNKTNPKYIIFEAYMGRQYSCSPKAVYEELQKGKKDYICVWAFKNPDEFTFLMNNKNTLLVKYGSKEYYKYYAKSKYWITNSRINEAILKKKNQVYIQCWHGTPLKKLGYDITVEGGNAVNSIKDIRCKYKSDSKRYTYMISPSKYCTEKFSSAFDIKDKSILKEIGYPRNDFLYNYTSKDVENIKNNLGISKNKKIILYAPTWRDNQHESGTGYVYEPEVDFDLLKKKLSDEYVILFRTHYFISNYIDLDQYEGFVYNVSQYNDINDLYIISDMLITDYSSVFFDFANLKRPLIFYMYDFDSYKNKLRDFYIDLDELPGPIIKEKNTEKIIKVIKNIDNSAKQYYNKYKLFNEKYNYLDDGKSSKRLIEQLLK